MKKAMPVVATMIAAVARDEMIRDTDGWLAQLSAEVALELSPELPARRITVRLTIDGLTRRAR